MSWIYGAFQIAKQDLEMCTKSCKHNDIDNLLCVCVLFFKKLLLLSSNCIWLILRHNQLYTNLLHFTRTCIYSIKYVCTLRFMVTYIICWNFYVNYIAELFNLKASTFVTGFFFYRPASWMWFWCFGQDLILLVPAVFLLLESFSAFFLILFVNIFS